MITSGTELSIDVLLRKRVHGAANIRGVRYQTLAAVLTALQRLPAAPPGVGVRLEGLEDFDRVGFEAGDEYVQAKFDRQPWAWRRMVGPIRSFLQLLRAPGANPRARYRLLVSFELRNEVATLAERDRQPLAQRKAIEDRFRRLVRELGGTDRDANDLLARLTIESLPEDDLWNRLRRAVADAFALGTESVETYLLVLVSRFLGWAEQRRTVTWADLQELRVSVGEALAREAEFQAYGRGLVQRMEWVADVQPNDFFDGKGTRPGHVAADVDVRRPRWLARIAESTAAARVCLIRAPSGQGKSALGYRAAREQGPAAGTFIVRIARTEDDVEQVRLHLRFRASLNLPLLVLIDVDSRTRRWFDVAEECAILGVPAIITIREEDWFRYGRESRFDYDVVEPWMDLEEAREVFAAFKQRGRIHPAVVSPEWAYERIREPHLLLEYVYLLTHGRMLEERLADQIRQFQEYGGSREKLEILRRASLSHALGVGISLRKLLVGIELRDDPHVVIGSMIGEYIQVRDGRIEGLHWVRSEHIARLLHQVYPNPADTVLALLPAVEEPDLPTVLSRAYHWVGLDRDRLIHGLAEYASLPGASLPLKVLEGLFQAGEQQFFSDHRRVFDRAYEHGRTGGTFLLASSVHPVYRIEPIAAFEALFPNVAALRELAEQLPEGPRGLHLCQQFLKLAAPHLTSDRIAGALAPAGYLLDWLALCGVLPPSWANIRDRIIEEHTVFELDIEDFCAFCQGLFRLDPDGYWRWYQQHEFEIRGYLKLHTGCIELTADRNVVRGVFLVDPDREGSPHEMKIARANRLRSALPFAMRYQMEGIWLMPLGLQPSVNDTLLDAPTESFPFRSDVMKNAVWGLIVDRSYFPDTHYSLQHAWFEARHTALEYVRWLSKWLQRIVAGKRAIFDQEAFNALVLRTREAIRSVPNPADRVAADAHAGIPRAAIRAMSNRGVSSWAFAFNNFFRQIHEYLVNGDEQSKRLLRHNFLSSLAHLKDIHDSFGELFRHVPDHFDAHKLNAPERTAYLDLADLLEAWLVNQPPAPWRRDPIQYVRAARARVEREGIARVRIVLEAEGLKVEPAREIYVEHPLKYLALYIEVSNPYLVFDDVILAATALAPEGDVADFYWIIPTWRGGRPLDRGYRFSATSLANLVDGEMENWETLVPQEVPPEILATLPVVPIRLPYGYDLWYGVPGLVQAMHVLRQWAELLEAVGPDGDRYGTELRERMVVRFEEITKEVGDQVEILRTSLYKNFGPVGDPNTVGIVDRYLDRFISNVRDGDYRLPDDSEEVVVEAVASLLDAVGEGTVSDLD